MDKLSVVTPALMLLALTSFYLCVSLNPLADLFSGGKICVYVVSAVQAIENNDNSTSQTRIQSVSRNKKSGAKICENHGAAAPWTTCANSIQKNQKTINQKNRLARPYGLDLKANYRSAGAELFLMEAVPGSVQNRLATIHTREARSRIALI